MNYDEQNSNEYDRKKHNNLSMSGNENENGNLTGKDKINKRKIEKNLNTIGLKNNRNEFRYKNLSQEMEDFCKILDEYNKINLMNKLNEKLKSNLSSSTVQEILEKEKLYEINQI
jgi:hypothetical protein